MEGWDPATSVGYEGDDIVDLLRLFGAGAAGSILHVLRDGPLRTGELADRAHGFAPRTVYRYVARLVQLGAVDREERPGVPSYVIYSLTETGRELSDLIRAFARASLELKPDGQVVPYAWRQALLLAELWESTMFDRLNAGPSTMTQLARVSEGLSFHQVSRRVDLLLNEGLIREVPEARTRRHYALTEPACRATALIVALGHWREQHLLDHGEPGLTADEMREVLKAGLSLTRLPRHRGKTFAFSIAETGDGNWKDGEVVWAAVAPDGAVDCNAESASSVDARVVGGIDHWTRVLLSGQKTGVRTTGDKKMIATLLRKMHRELWAPRRKAEDAGEQGQVPGNVDGAAKSGEDEGAAESG